MFHFDLVVGRTVGPVVIHFFFAASLATRLPGPLTQCLHWHGQSPAGPNENGRKANPPKTKDTQTTGRHGPHTVTAPTGRCLYSSPGFKLVLPTQGMQGLSPGCAICVELNNFWNVTFSKSR